MKKNMSVLVMSLVMTVCFLAQADLAIDRLWTSLYVDAGTGLGGAMNNNDGIGWLSVIYNQTDGAETAAATNNTIGWLDGFGYGINQFQFTATEADTVLLRLYDNASEGSATFRLDSETQVLSNLDNSSPPGINDLNVTFSFSGSSWQAVPEPATALLFGIGGMGVWLLRRSKLNSKEVADV